MMWKINLTKEADKFLLSNKNKVPREEIFELISRTVIRLQGDDINVDIKKLKGDWLGFYRIRKGKLRIIVEFDFDNFAVLIEKVDWRGSAY